MTAWVMNQPVTATRRAPRPGTTRSDVRTHPSTRRPAVGRPQPGAPSVARAATGVTGTRRMSPASCDVARPARAVAVPAGATGPLRLTQRGLALVTLTMLSLMLLSLTTVVGQFWMISGS